MVDRAERQVVGERSSEQVEAQGAERRSIPCLNCGGRGYQVAGRYGGIRQPVLCQGCKGTGIQQVRP